MQRNGLSEPPYPGDFRRPPLGALSTPSRARDGGEEIDKLVASVVKDKFHNVPKQLLYGWVYPLPGPTRPE